jgi:beta-fructofuranosidase
MRADGFGACLVGKLPDQCQIDVTARTSGQTTSCGLLLRADEGLETYYRLRWEPIQHRIVFDEWPIRGRDFWPRPADKPFALERSIGADGVDNIKIRLVIDGSVMVAYVNDVEALTCRAYDHREGHLGLFVSDGEATFANLAIRRR